MRGSGYSVIDNEADLQLPSTSGPKVPDMISGSLFQSFGQRRPLQYLMCMGGQASHRREIHTVHT